MTASLLPIEESALARLLPELLRLSPTARLEVISQLVESVKMNASSASYQPLSGAWADNGESAEEIAESLRAARQSSRPPVSLD